MRKFYFLLIALFVSFISTAQVSLTATGGATSGSYTTLKAAFDKINDGTHQGQIEISLTGNTTETATAAILASGTGSSSYTSITVTATVPVTISGNIIGAIIKLQGADNVTFDGRIGGSGRNITVANTNTSGSTAAFWVTSTGVGAGATNNTIRNLEIACGVNQTTSSSSTFGIILCSNNTSISVSSNSDDCDNNSFIANRIIRCRYGIVTRGTTTNLTLNTVVRDNIIGPSSFGADQIGKVGIFMQADQGAVVSGNTVQYVGKLFSETNTTGADRVGIGIGQESWSMSPSTLTSGSYTVTNNIIRDIVEERTFSACGLILCTTGGGSATNNLVANNFIFNVRSNGTSGDQTVGLGISGGHSDRVVFNSIYLSGDVDPGSATASTNFGSGIRIANASGSSHQNLLLQNNSVYMDLSSSSTSANRYYAISGPANTYSFGTGGENYNNYYINPSNSQVQTGGLGTTSGNTLTTQFATLAQWAAAYSTPQDANSIQSNPNHNSATDLHISATSPNAGAGISVSGVLLDIDNQLRDATVDIGADDPTGTTPPANDISAGSFINPVLGDIKGSATPFTPQASFVNLGSNAQSNIPVRFRIINSSLVEVYNNAQTITALAALGGGSNAVFTPVTLPAGTYTMYATSELSGDGVATNNEISGTFTVLNPLSGSYAVGTGGDYTSITNNGGIFQSLNQLGASSNITINIISDLTAETGAHGLNELPSGVTVLIKPQGAPRTISGSINAALISINGADGVTIDGSTSGATAAACLLGGDASIRELTIQNTNTGTSATAVLVSSGLNGAVGTTIKNVKFVGADPTTSLVGVSIGGATPGSSGADNDNTRIENCSFSRFILGIYAAGTSTSNPNVGAVFSQNYMAFTGPDRLRRNAILVFSTVDLTVSFNDIGGIDNSGESADAFGMAFGTQNISTSATASTIGIGNATISNNRIRGVQNDATYSASGIAVAHSNLGLVTLSNNMVSGVISDGNSGDFVAGIFVHGGGAGSSTRLYNNTVYLSGVKSDLLTPGTNQEPSYGVAILGTDPILDMRNNIVSNVQTTSLTSNASSFSYAVGIASSTFLNLTSDYNAYWTAGANAKGFRTVSLSTSSGTDYTTVLLYSGATTKDVNSKDNISPVFVSATDLHLSNAFGDNLCLNQAGAPITGLTTDIDCDTRGSSPDIGADEFSPAPPTFTVTSPAAVCFGGSVDLTAIGVTAGSTAGQSFTYFTDAAGTSVLTNPAAVSVTGTYYINSSYTSCGTTFDQIQPVTVTINALPTVSIAVTETSGTTNNDGTICNTGSATLTASGAVSYAWAPGGATTAAVTVSPAATTTYTVTGTDANGCQNTASTTITVNALPTPSITVAETSGTANNDGTICAGASASLTASGGVSYLWAPGGATTAAITVSPSATTTYTATATDANGCSADASATITVNALPTAYTVTGGGAYCSGGVGVGVGLSSSDIGISYELYLDGTATGTTATGTGSAISFGTFTTAGTYTVVATNTATGCTNNMTGSVAVSINPLPVISQTITEPTTCISTDGAINLTISGAAGPYTYNWTGTGVVAAQEDQTGIRVGSYSVVVTAANGCQATANYTLLGPGGCDVCPTIGAVVTNPVAVCQDGTAALNATGLTDLGVSYGISFVVSATPLANPYTGTVVATIPNGSLGVTTAGPPVVNNATTNYTFTTAGTMYVYAILSPAPVDPSCRPFKVAQINVVATPNVNDVTNVTVCPGATTAPINFSGTVPGTTYSWTSDNTSIGIAASGTGNIGSFTATNFTNTPVTATITVTPNNTFNPPSFAYITNFASNDVSVINTNTNTVIATIPVGANPNGLCYSPDKSKVYVANYGSASVSVINTATNTVSATIPVVGFPFAVSISPDGSKLYVSDGGFGIGITVVNTATNTVITSIATATSNGSVVSLDGAKIFSTNSAIAGVNVINSATNTIIASIPTGTSPSGLRITPDGSKVYVSNYGDGTVSAIDVATNTVVATIPLGITDNYDLSISPDGTKVYATSYVGNVAKVIDVNTNTVVGTITGLNRAAGISIMPDGSKAYITDANIPGRAYVVDLASNTLSSTVTVGDFPRSLGEFIIAGSGAALTCPGPSKIFTITVNPRPTVNTVTNVVACNAATVSVPFGGFVPGTVYEWTNSNTAIGLAASGTGSLSFTATNSGTAPISANIIVTPKYTNNGVTCTGAPIAFTITINPTPTVNAVSNQVVCNNGATTAVSFSGTVPGTVYNWTNSAPSIGLLASGTGNIASFTAVNTGTSPVTATITVTPSYTNGGTTCDGTATTFTIIVNPAAQVNTVTNQTVCNGDNTTAINFTTANTGGTTTYSWTNDTPSIGLLASGTGNIAAFAATNTGSSPVTATITVTPSYSNGGQTCTGTARTFTITVNPTPTAVATPASQTICSATAITNIVLTGSVSGTTYSWTRNNTTTVTGVAASGTGNITGTLTNTTNAPVTVTFTITPLANGCTGTAITATVVVNPTPNAVATPASQTICSATAISNIVLTGNVTGTTYSWTRDNTTAVTGIAASGTGNITGTLTNTTNAPVTVTFTITPSANGCTGTAITATVVVNPTPNAVATPASQTICSATAISNIVLTGNVTGTTYSWTRNNTTSVTGIAASGTGNIIGTLTNTTNAPVTVTFTITPSANGCTGTAITATVLVNPTPNAVATPAAQTICTGSAIGNIVLSGNVAGTTYAWTRNNTTTVTGIAASGSGNITGTLTNTTTAPVTVTFTITPSANGCAGAPITATVIVNPIPTVNAINNQVVCNRASTTAIAFSGAVTGTVYNWSNNTPSIGLAASGVGDIAAFTAVNTTQTPVVATITVTPTYTNGGVTCTGTPRTFTITVNPTPIVTATDLFTRRICISDGPVALNATPVGGSWSGNGVSGFNFIPAASAVGRFVLTYTFTNQFGCTSTDTTTAIVSACDERNRSLENRGAFIYPNPNDGQFNIRINSTRFQFLQMRIYNSAGQLVSTKQWNGLVFGQNLPIDMRHLAAGMYSVRLIYDGGNLYEDRAYQMMITH